MMFDAKSEGVEVYISRLSRPSRRLGVNDRPIAGGAVTKWFVQRANSSEELGPYRPSELLDLVRNGDVSPETLLRKDDSQWFTAGDVGGLFEAAMRPTIRYFCPQCKTEVSEPPVTCHKCDFNVIRALTEITENTIVNRTEPGTDEPAGNSVKKWLQKKRLSRDSNNPG